MSIDKPLDAGSQSERVSGTSRPDDARSRSDETTTSEEEDRASQTMPRSEKRLEIFATVLLAIAAVATAWSSYQAALWDGIQSSKYTQASALRTKSAQKQTTANQGRLADLSLLESFLNAESRGDLELAEFFRKRFRPEFKPAFAAWTVFEPRTNPRAPSSPMDLPEYRLPAEEESVALSADADATFKNGEEANSFSDTYVATTLFFASVLFFAAISERFEYRPARVALLTLAGFGLIGGIAIVVTQRVTFG